LAKKRNQTGENPLPTAFRTDLFAMFSYLSNAQIYNSWGRKNEKDRRHLGPKEM